MNEQAARNQLRLLQLLWDNARALQNNPDGTLRRLGDQHHASALALENELVDALVRSGMPTG